jgi:hypothetical protein
MPEPTAGCNQVGQAFQPDVSLESLTYSPADCGGFKNFEL